MFEGFEKMADHASKQVGKKHRVKSKVPDYKDFFVPAFNVLEPGTKLQMNWHIPYLCDELQKEIERIARREEKEHDLIINIMPRSLKSYIVTILLNAWTWAKYPELKFVTTSYASSLSVEHSGKTRKLIKSDWYQDNFGEAFDLDKSQDAKSYFANTKGGERKASSVGGQLTGSGGNILVFDDPVKPPSKDEITVNINEIKAANNWHDDTAFNRINDPKVDLRLYVMQRLHNKDMTGYLLEEKEHQDYKHICIPGELNDYVKPESVKKFYMPDDVYGDSKLFFKDRFSKKILLQYEESMGISYSGQVDQNPSSEEGGTWKLEYFTPIKRKDLPPRKGKQGTGWDLATSKTAKKKNSSSAYVYGFRWQNALYVTQCGWFFKEFPDVVTEIKKGSPPHWIENKSAGKDAVPQLKKDGVDAKEHKNKNRDKFQMAAFGANRAKRLKVYVVQDIWDKLLEGDAQGITQFPSASWDDLHDAFCIWIENISDGMISSEDIDEMLLANKVAQQKSNRNKASTLGSIRRDSTFSGNSI